MIQEGDQIMRKVYGCPNCGANPEYTEFYETVVYLVELKIEDGRIIRDKIDQPLGSPIRDGRYICSHCGDEFDEFVEEDVDEH